MTNLLRNSWYNIVAATFLFGALGNHPYGYYQLLRWVVCAITIYNVYLNKEKNNQVWTWIFGITAVLFNPIIPFYLSKVTWQYLDVIGAMIFIVSILSFKHKKISS